MKRENLLTILCALWLMLAGCEVFPYVTETEVQPLPSSTTTSSQPSPTQVTMTTTLEVPPTATLETSPEPTSTTTSILPTPTKTIKVEVDLPIQTPTYKLQDGNPIYLPNFAYPESGCEWLGVAGQVFDAQGFEVQDLIIAAGDIQIGDEQQWSTQTGLAQSYGPGGYEIQLSEIPQDSKERFWVQVLDQDGNLLSERLFFDTFDDCAQNLILINFVFIENSSAKTMPTPTLAGYP